LYDLVVLSGGGSANEVGCIVRVGREDFTVVNNHGINRDVRPEELRGKRNQTSTRAVALDVSGNQIRCGDSVNVAEGPHKGKIATIKRMSRAQLFLYSQTRSEHAGIFVVRSRSCLLAGSRTQTRGIGGDGGASPFNTPQSQSRGPPGGAKRDDALVGKTVRIQSGQWKGYLGSVCDATATHVQVELHSRLKKVMVVRERVAVVGDKFGAVEEVDQNDPSNQNGASSAPSFAGGTTPMHGGATPMHGGATPMHDSMAYVNQSAFCFLSFLFF
jgi:transcription elongation factor SPT5